MNIDPESCGSNKFTHNQTSRVGNKLKTIFNNFSYILYTELEITIAIFIIHSRLPSYSKQNMQAYFI
jgi:hypothetical protein